MNKFILLPLIFISLVITINLAYAAPVVTYDKSEQQLGAGTNTFQGFGSVTGVYNTTLTKYLQLWNVNHLALLASGNVNFQDNAITVEVSTDNTTWYQADTIKQNNSISKALFYSDDELTKRQTLTVGTGLPTFGKITVAPDNGTAATETNVNGLLFAPSSFITLYYDDTIVGNATSDTLGSFSQNITIPTSTAGNHTISASDGPDSDTVLFTYDTGGPVLTLTPINGTMGATVTFTGTGWTPGTVGIKFNHVTIATSPGTITASGGGAITGTFVIPTTTYQGLRAVTATDSAPKSAGAIQNVIAPAQTLTSGNNVQLNPALFPYLRIEVPNPINGYAVLDWTTGNTASLSK